MSPQPPAGHRSLLLVGESWFSHTIHQKGFDSFTTSTYEEGCATSSSALESRQWTVEHVPSHLVDTRMPSTLEALRQHAGDRPVRRRQQHVPTRQADLLDGRVAPDLLELIAAYTAAGGGLVMVGGYMSFGGIDAKAGYGRTCLQDVLPVTVSASDDRVEKPAGVVPPCNRPTTQPSPGSPAHGPRCSATTG